MNIDEAKAALEAHLKSARAIALKAEQENRDFTETEQHDLNEYLLKAKEAKDVLDNDKNRASMLDTIKALGEGVELNDGKRETKTASGLIVPGENGSLGEQFVKHQAFQDLQKSLPQSPNSMGKMRIESASVGVKTLVTGTDDTSAGVFVMSERRQRYEELGRREFVMRGLVSVQTTQSDTIDYVITETTNTNNAAPVAEATTDALPTQNQTTGPLVNNAGGGYKPQGALAYSTASTTVKTLAEWMPVTKRALADAGQIRGLIDQKLRTDLAEVEDAQILNGSGSGENLRGILNTSGILTQAASATILNTANGTPGLAAVETISHAKTKIRTTGRRQANAVVCSPLVAENLYLYRIANQMSPDGVAGQVNQTVAGLPIVVSEIMGDTTVLVGDFSEAILWDREQTSLTVTDSHADFFIRNLVAILAEERVAFAVTRPSAFCVATLPAWTA
jgi:HK97 family phage major capsid protein